MTAAPAPTLADLATAYAVARTPETLVELRHAVLTSRGYDARLDLESSGRSLLDAGDHTALLALVRERMPGAFLSPSAHALLAAAHAGLGDEERAARERRTSRLALDSILSTGDGSAERPWSVLRISDEYDVLAAQDRRSVEQELVVDGDRALDHHRCADGSEAWFDVTLTRVR